MFNFKAQHKKQRSKQGQPIKFSLFLLRCPFPALLFGFPLFVPLTPVSLRNGLLLSSPAFYFYKCNSKSTSNAQRRPKSTLRCMRQTHRWRLQAMSEMQHLPVLVLRVRVANHQKRVTSEVPHWWWRILMRI